MTRIELMTTRAALILTLGVLLVAVPAAADAPIGGSASIADGSTAPKGRQTHMGTEVPSSISVTAHGTIEGRSFSFGYYEPGVTFIPPGSLNGFLSTGSLGEDAIPMTTSGGLHTLMPYINMGGGGGSGYQTVLGALYFNTKGPSISCSADSCSGSINLSYYSMWGNVSGTVQWDTGEFVPAGYPVVATDPDGIFKPVHQITQTGGQGYFSFAAFTADELINRERASFGLCPTCVIDGPIEIPAANHWGLQVLGDGCDRPQFDRKICTKTPGKKDWVISGGGQTQRVTVHSNMNEVVQLGVPVATPTEAPPTDVRPPTEDTGSEPKDESGDDHNDDSKHKEKPLCADVLRPVRVTTGNMYLDQQDGILGGLRGPLTFTRSYNSQRAYRGDGGIFGPGWSHSFEKKLTVLAPDHLRLDLANGNAVYFVAHPDQTFHAYAPASETSVIAKTGDTYVRSFRVGGSESYDSAGRLTSQTDRLGNVTTLTYTAGVLTRIADPNGRAFMLVYNEDSMPIELHGPDGLLATYSRATDPYYQVDYPDGTGHRFKYAGGWQLSQLRDATGRVVEKHEYEGNRAVTSEVDHGVEKFTLSYAPGVTTVTDGEGRVTTYNWGTFGGVRLPTKISGYGTCEAGEASEATYDKFGRMSTRTDGAGRVTIIDRNSRGEIIEVREPMGRTTGYGRDALGRVTTRTSPGGVRGATFGLGGLLTSTDTANRTSTIVRNGLGKPTTVTDKRGKTSTITYTPMGEVATITDPLGHTTSFTYDSRGRRKTRTDALGRTTTMTYDTRDRLTRVTYPDGTHIGFEFDKAGRVKTAKDRQGRVRQLAYDELGRLQGISDPLRGEVRYGYDMLGRVVSLRDSRGQTTRFEYDSYARVKRTVYPDGSFEASTYDGAGYSRTETDRKGVVSTFVRDDLNRPRSVTYSDGTPSLTYDYDTAGRLVSAANDTDSLVWEYDGSGDLRSEQSTFNGSTVGYSYDSATGLKTAVSLDGVTILEYGYDAALRLATITHGASVFSLDYDAKDRLSKLTYPNGVVTDYAFDSLSAITSIVAMKAGVPVTGLTYSYDGAGQVTNKVTADSTETYVYDSINRIIRAERTGADADRWVWSYDSAGNRTGEQVGVGQLERATYNELNQLVSRQAGGTLLVSGTVDEASAVTVGARPARTLGDNAFEIELPATPGTNTFAVEAKDGSGNVRTNTYEIAVTGGTAAYQYDRNGNLVQKAEAGSTWTYEWNVRGELTRVTKDGAEVARYRYDPLGRRVEKVAGGVTSRFAYDGLNMLRESRAGVAKLYVHGVGLDQPLAGIDAATSASVYYHADALGSIVRTTDSSGAVTSTRAYDPWGRPEAGAAEGGYAYTGREWEPEIGSYYYRARYYDPQLGRFLSADPKRFAAGNNFYTYVDDNPTNRRDPLGLFAVGIGGVVEVSGGVGVGFAAEGSAQVVVDGYGNLGSMFCGGAGAGVALGAEIGLGAKGTYCPTCSTICGLNEAYVSAMVSAEMGHGGFVGGSVEGGFHDPSTVSNVIVNVQGGGAVGAGMFAGILGGECHVVPYSGQKCEDCEDHRRH